MSCSEHRWGVVRTTPGRPGRPLVRSTPDEPPLKGARTTLVPIVGTPPPEEEL